MQRKNGGKSKGGGVQVAPMFSLSLAGRNFVLRFRFISTPSTAFSVLTREGGSKHPSRVVAVEISFKLQ